MDELCVPHHLRTLESLYGCGWSALFAKQITQKPQLKTLGFFLQPEVISEVGAY